MKKTLRLLAVTFFAIFLTACNIQTVEQFEKMEDQEQSVEHSPTDEQVEQLEREDPTPPDTEQEQNDATQQEEQPKETADEETKQTQVTATEETKQTQVTEAETKTHATEKQEQTVPQQANKQQAVTGQANEQPKQQVTEQPKQQVTEQPKQPIEQPQKKRSVTIAIRVDTLLKNWDLLDPSLQSEKYVPQNGVILKTTTYELLSEEDTVWDVLQRATKEHKIQIEYQGANENIYNSVYIEGINHLYEFSAGPLSGWMYKVNGVYPNYGCSQYTLQDGDVIEWHYTVDLGRDLGHEWTGE